MASRNFNETESFRIDMELDLKEDVAAELEDFILLSRLGVVEEALQMVEHVLWRHFRFFPVYAEVCIFLIQIDEKGLLRKIVKDLDIGAISLRTQDGDEKLFIDVVRHFAHGTLTPMTTAIIGFSSVLDNNLDHDCLDLEYLLTTPDLDSPVQVSGFYKF